MVFSFFGGLEHQPSPRSWAESNLVAGPVHFILFIYLFFFSLFCFVCFFYYLYIFFESCDFPTDFSMSFRLILVCIFIS